MDAIDKLKVAAPPFRIVCVDPFWQKLETKKVVHWGAAYRERCAR